ncbi:MAG: hypothetical protein HC819_22245 [Cyclobacteriaceae bacterium]|nr:hypothetical protein [Cyclobacteriaceae bacterium]
MEPLIRYKLISHWILSTLIGVMLLSPLAGFANTQAKKDRVRMKMYYFKEATGDRKVSITLTAGTGKNMHGVSEGQVVLSAASGDSTMVLATLTTDTTGTVVLYFAADYILPVNEDGKTVLEALYEGDENYQDASNAVEVMDLKMEIIFEIEDSVKQLVVKASTTDAEGNEIPAEELSINIGVQRLYSVLKLEEVETDSDGMAFYEFPNDIPGDAEGNITVVARIDDSDEFGTVTSQASHNWGTLVSYELDPLPRQLYTDEAPLWMIISVFVILLGAWYHFFLSISKLIKLKKVGKQAEGVVQ